MLSRRSLPLGRLMHRRIPIHLHRNPIIIPYDATLHNIPLHPPEHGPPRHRRPRVHGLDDVDQRERLAVKVGRDLLAQVLAAAEAADQQDGRDGGAAGVLVDALELLDEEVEDHADDGVEDGGDFGRGDGEAAVGDGGRGGGFDFDGDGDGIGLVGVVADAEVGFDLWAS